MTQRWTQLLSRRTTAALAVAVATALAAAAPAAHAAPTETEYIIQFKPSVATPAARAAAVRAAGGTVTRDVRLINAVGARLSAGEAAALAHSAAVKAVSRNGGVQSTWKANF